MCTNHPAPALLVSAVLCLTGCEGCQLPGLQQGSPGAACEPVRHDGVANRIRTDGGSVESCTRISELHLSCDEEFRQGGTLDVVWVIDTSPSMEEEIEGIRANMNQFAQQIGGTGLDYHVVLVSSGKEHAFGLCIPEPLGGPGCTNNTRFMHVREEVYSTDGPRILLENYHSFEMFLRADAQHHVVYVTDDNSDLSARDYVAALPGAAPKLVHAVHHGVVGMSMTECPAIANVGEEYIDLAESTGGVLVPICCDDYAKVVQWLAQDVAASTLRFPLLHPANPGTVKVFTEDAQGNRTAVAAGWQYDERMQAVVFEETARPSSGAVVAITYVTSG